MITTLDASWNPVIMPIILYPSHPATEPTFESSTSEFGKRFGIPLYNSNGKWYARLISSLELLRYYGVHTNLLHNPHIWLGMDVVLNEPVPGCLSLSS